jgi:hypothetical protein
MSCFGFIKKSKGFPAILIFLGISQNCFCIGKVMNQVYKSQDHGWLLVHGGLTTMRQRGRYRARKVIVTTQKEREVRQDSHQ